MVSLHKQISWEQCIFTRFPPPTHVEEQVYFYNLRNYFSQANEWVEFLRPFSTLHLRPAAAERASLCFKEKGNTNHQITPWLWHNDAISMIRI